MKLSDFPEVAALSARDKLLLVDELWSALGAQMEALEVTDKEKDLLDARLAAYDADPSSALSLDELLQKLGKKKA